MSQHGAFDEFLQRQVELLAVREAIRVELDILTGCAICGRRMIIDDKPVEGACLASFQTPVNIAPSGFERIPICSVECLNKLSEKAQERL